MKQIEGISRDFRGRRPSENASSTKQNAPKKNLVGPTGREGQRERDEHGEGAEERPVVIPPRHFLRELNQPLQRQKKITSQASCEKKEEGS